MNDTKQRILDVSLDLFSRSGFSAVSIRDICGQVQIKESSIYYYFKNKQAIFDELLCLFEEKARDMMSQLDAALAEQTFSATENFYQTVCDTFFNRYLMDNFCNKVIRLILIEQFRNSAVQKVYDFIWDEFCDWYIEITKTRTYKKEEDPKSAKTAKAPVSLYRPPVPLDHPIRADQSFSVSSLITSTASASR